MAAVVRPASQRIRQMRREDIPEVHDIESDAYEFGWTQGIFRDCLQAGHECWLLQMDREIVAYAVLANQVHEAHLLNLCVAPAWQGVGHGQRLLRRMTDVARWHAAERMLLEVRPSNPAAIHIYQQHGFEIIGRRPGYYPATHGREDAVVMALRLRPSLVE
ncbi:MAG: ribosomal protein S18-alanine N-acetyltransferase [Rhodanobacteraceae bacterium]